MRRSSLVKHVHQSETEPANTITEVTRRAIIDYLSVGRYWSGALQEDDFLGRLYDLKRMPSPRSLGPSRSPVW
jgi:hypothetical protein